MNAAWVPNRCCQFKAQHAAIKFQRAFKVGDFQMHVADVDTKVKRPGRQVFFHGESLIQFRQNAMCSVRKALPD